jgi:2-polyprenyl-3-methyl-5-hydroxy-6-metoxy-1,4-benzoquinol methylase
VALVTEAEKQAYQNLSFDNVADLLIYACYAPLSSIAESQKVTKWTKDTIAKPIIQIQYQDYQKEKMLIQSIPSFSKVYNKISQKVRAQYEENPYPRWQVAHNLSGKKIHITPAGKRTGRYLIAGCGTGRLSVQIGFTATDMDIDCIDLSFASLGYAKRKAQEYGLSHLHFKQGDLLDIAALQHKYDVINCAGVLHHMDDPVAGWRALVNVMNPKGRMMIALYSRQARQHIKMAQEMIKEKGYGDSADDIRAFRHDLMALSADHPLRTLTHVRDFYTLSNCRDLLFHVQETWYDLPEIAKIAEDLGLVFTGFKLQDLSYGIQYQKEFPDDPEMLNLDNWHRFEQKNPHIFVSMYQMNFTQKGVF